jgi:cell division control protein 6
MLNFKPYEIPQIVDIINDRLQTLEKNMSPLGKSSPMKKGAASADSPIIQKNAIEFCARKVAGTGDVRRALDVCRYLLFSTG